MPPSAATKHVEDNMLMDKDKITLNLVVELVWDFNAAHVVGARLGPLTTDLACLNDLWDQSQSLLGHPNSFKETFHDMLGSMPPPNMELTKGEPYSTCSVGAKEANNTTDVESRPVVGVLWVVALVAKGATISLLEVRTSTSSRLLVWVRWWRGRG